MRTELVFGEAVELDAVGVLVGFAAHHHWDGMLFRKHGDQSGARASEHRAVRVD